MRSTPSLKAALMLGMACLSLTGYAANGPDTFMNGKSFYGEPTPQASAARVVDIAAARYVNVTHGETVAFRSGSQQFSWTFNGLGGRAVDVAKIAPAGFAAKPLTVYVGRDPLNRN